MGVGSSTCGCCICGAYFTHSPGEDEGFVCCEIRLPAGEFRLYHSHTDYLEGTTGHCCEWTAASAS